MKDIKIFARCASGNMLEFKSVKDGDAIVFSLDGALFEDEERIIIGEDAFRFQKGARGYYIVPGEEKNAGAALVTFKERTAAELIRVDNPTLNFFAVCDGDQTRVFMIEYNYLYRAEISFDGDNYSLSLVIKSADNIIEDAVVIRALTLFGDADYNDVARAVREYRLSRGEIAPLSQKRALRAELDYAASHPLLRIRMGWKPVPTPVEHQTIGNEPPMHVACTFSEVRELADALHERGVEGVEISLVGWNSKGHDGRFPQIFPVEEALGGEEELLKTVKHVQSLGYAITCHTNCADHYEIAEDFDRNNLALKKNGEYKTHGGWSGGMSYGACPIRQLERARRDLSPVADLGFRGLHYIDCVSLTRPDVCFSEEHPSKLSNSIKCLLGIMDVARELFGGFSSEGIRDFALGKLDFSLYNCFRSPLESFASQSCTIVDEVIPMAELIYHGIVLYNPSSATVNSTVKGARTEALSVVLGGRPSLYIYSKFLTSEKNIFGGISNNWMGEEDLMLGSAEALLGTVDAVARACENYSLYRDLQDVFIKSYKRVGDVRSVVYENGVKVIANLGDAPASYDGVTLSAGEFKVVR